VYLQQPHASLLNSPPRTASFSSGGKALHTPQFGNESRSSGSPSPPAQSHAADRPPRKKAARSFLSKLDSTYTASKEWALAQFFKGRRIFENWRMAAKEHLLTGLAGLYFCPLPGFARRYLERKVFFAPPTVCSIRPLKRKYPELEKDIERILFSADDGKDISAWMVEAKPGMPTIVVNHGRARNISDMGPIMNAFHKKGYGIFAYDPPGFGKSEGRPSEAAFKKSGLTACRYLAEKRGIPYHQQVLWGHSLGGAGAIDAASKLPEKPKALMGVNTFTTPAEAFRSKVTESNSRFKWLLNHKKIQLVFDSIGAIQSKSLDGVPILLLHSRKDDIIAPKLGVALHQAAQERKKLAQKSHVPCQFKYLEQGDHYLLEPLCEEITKYMDQFLKTIPALEKRL
jgi:alpha-beta hydrolase superfamily lysophospholipase